MRKEYDFSKAKKNPYATLLKKQVTIRLDEGTIKYFKKIAEDVAEMNAIIEPVAQVAE